MTDTGALPLNAAPLSVPMVLYRRLRRTVARMPALYLPLRRARHPHTVLGPATDLVIEGFPRCGNTWAEFALREVAPAGLVLAHHSHAAAHVLAAVRCGVPVLVLFRDPDDAVTSLLAMSGGRVDAREAFQDYVAFYRALEPLARETVLFAGFGDVTTRMGAVVAALNARFGLDLAPFDDTCPKARARIRAGIEARARQRGRISRCTPNHETGDRAAARAAISAPGARRARQQAQEVHARLQSDIEATQ